ncbi:MAG: nucleotidyltransferase [Lachnospiraceae bacterium]|nr:nucleotidyltransferase [Lachnospiraceae bacterium]
MNSNGNLNNCSSKDPVLVVLAAGIGSRFGGGVKQLAGVGPSGEIILDYSIYDAIEAGFKKVIFIIRHDIEADFREAIGDRLAGRIQVEYAFQEGDDLPEGFTKPAGRTKPWGTGHAVLACRDVIDAPFAVINADDYYGREAYQKMYAYLKNDLTEGRCSMVGFVMKNTLSDNGVVTRGVCHVNEAGALTGVDETKNIGRDAEGLVKGSFDGREVTIDPEALVSMNFWGFNASFLEALKSGFVDFLAGLEPEDVKSEYLLPIIVDGKIKDGSLTVDVLTSGDRWFGITYKEDKEAVEQELKALTDKGMYPTPIFG